MSPASPGGDATVQHHLVGCGIGIALALTVVWLAGGSAGSIGVLIALLLCPALMLMALGLLVRGGSEDGDGANTGASTAAARPDVPSGGPVGSER